ncbi:MAG: hypothetical protein EON89_11730 [Brevundimonas sp.]|nr:MAG: hypothetical protein EON89_11730 [Brevundimonas sp.]
MWRRLSLFSALTLAATPVAAQVETVSARADRTAVVIYRDGPVDTSALMAQSAQPWNRLDREGLALIVETRTIDLPAGEAVIRLRGVATGIVPQTATLDGLPAHVVERNTDFDLLSPGSLLAKSIGEVVRVVRTNPVNGEQVERSAIVRSGPSGTVLEIDGKLEALDCSGLTERIVFDKVPEGLSDQPTLSIRTRAETAGRHTVTLAYLATGLQWSADYVARLAPDGQTLDLTGWITLANFGGTGFRDAPVQVVAGRLNRDDGTLPVEPALLSAAPQCWPQDTTTNGPDEVVIQGYRMAPPPPPPPSPVMSAPAGRAEMDQIIVTASRIARQSELGDYKIYTLPETTDVLARQTKQVRFLEREDVRFTRIYQARLDASETTEGEAPQLVLRLRNDERNGLGVALPGGGVSVMETQGGRGLLSGQAKFEDRGIGLPVELPFGQAMGLSVSQTSTDLSPSSRNRARYAVEATVSNDKTEAVEIELVPNEAGVRGFRIVRSSSRSVITDAGLPAWRLRVPAGETTTLTYEIEFGG